MVKLGERTIENFTTPYIIAELGSNHNGDMELARQLIVSAKKAGADCVKFQSWSKDTIFSKKVYQDNCFLKDDYSGRKDYSLEEIVEKFSISEDQLIAMSDFCEEIGIDCTSTPFSKSEVDFLVEKIKPPFIKIASMDLNNYPFLEYIASKGLPMILSVGLSELHEIDRAVRTIENTGNKQLIILHCVSLYPPKDVEVNLNNIKMLRKIYPYPIGFSDHTLGFSVPLAAVALGASVVEKHFTLNKDAFGWDHKVSADPDELKIICNESQKIHKALGSYRIFSEENQQRKSAFRRSIIVNRDLKSGEMISKEDIDYKRPGSGIDPGETKYVLGRKLAKEKKRDDLLYWNDFES